MRITAATHRMSFHRTAWRRFCVLALLLLLHATSPGMAADLEWIRVSDDGSQFVHEKSGRLFIPWGVNYDHQAGSGKLLEDYWHDEWATIEEDFAEIRQLGANLVRVHLQFGRFMKSPDQPDESAIRQLARLVKLAEKTGLYLDVTGLGCYHKQDVPEWYDALAEPQRWAAQAKFWEAVAKCCARSPAIFCYDLMNEPVVPGGKGKRDDWLGGAFGGKHFVQFIALETKDRPRHEIARVWIDQLVAAVRKHDRRHMITVGLVPWSLDRPGLTSGFIPEKVTGKLDFIAVHLYPETGKLDDAMQTLRGFDIGKPLLIEETFPLKCSPEDLITFIDRSRPIAEGWVSFYWGRTVAEYEREKSLRAAIVSKWLVLFSQNVKAMR